MQLGRNSKLTRVSNAVAAGTTTITSGTIDMQDYEGVLFIVQFGTITDGTPAVKARQGQLSNMSDAADLLGTLTSGAITDDNKCAVLDVFRPLERYVDCQVIRGGATGAVIDSILAIQYGPRSAPTSHDASVAVAEYHVSPAEGTA